MDSVEAWPFEGTYFDPSYDDKPTVKFENGRYYGSVLTNPGGDMDGSGEYTVRDTGRGTWELDFRYIGAAQTTTVYVRKDGDDIWIRYSGVDQEIRLCKK